MVNYTDVIPYGLSLVTVTNPIPNRTDLLDYNGNATIQTARYINPQTHDFEVSVNKNFQGENATEQAVLLALNTTFNSSSFVGFGQNFKSIKTITPSIKTQVNSVVSNALYYLTSTNAITLSNVSIANTGPGQLSIQINYFNNSLGTSSSVSVVPIGQ